MEAAASQINCTMHCLSATQHPDIITFYVICSAIVVLYCYKQNRHDSWQEKGDSNRIMQTT